MVYKNYRLSFGTIEYFETPGNFKEAQNQVFTKIYNCYRLWDSKGLLHIDYTALLIWLMKIFHRVRSKRCPYFFSYCRVGTKVIFMPARQFLNYFLVDLELDISTSSQVLSMEGLTLGSEKRK